MSDGSAGDLPTTEHDSCWPEEHDPAVVEAFTGFYRQLGALNVAMDSLADAARRRDVTVLLLARMSLAWDMLDARLTFLAAASRSGEGVRGAPILAAAVERFRQLLQGGLAYRRDSGTAGEILAQTTRLAQRLRPAVDTSFRPAPSSRWRSGSRPTCRRTSRQSHQRVGGLSRLGRG